MYLQVHVCLRSIVAVLHEEAYVYELLLLRVKLNNKLAYKYLALILDDYALHTLIIDLYFFSPLHI